MRRHRTVLAQLGVVLVVGVVVRLPQIDEPPARYHPTRQYFSELLARDLLASVRPEAASVERELARATRSELIEPPVMEVLSVGGFVVTGQQSWWLPRVLSLACWTAAAALTFVLGRRLGGPVVGLVAAAVVQLAPGTAEAARSFQPESLLLLLIAGATLALARLAEEPLHRRRFVVAGLLLGAATAVKVTAALVLLPYAVLVVAPLLRRPAQRVGALLLAALAALPSLLWYGWGFLSGFLDEQAGGRVMPSLWIEADYWTGWSRMLGQVVPTWLLVAAAAGAVLAPPQVRRVVATLFAGYLLLGLTFTYHASTHSYYSLPLLITVGLGAGSAAATALGWAPTAVSRRALAATFAAVAALAAASILEVTRSAPAASAQPHLAASVEIGRVLPDDAHVVAVTPDYGSALRFYGGVRTTWWPSVWDLRYAQLQGERTIPASVRLRDLATSGATHLVVLDDTELRRQPDLAAVIGELRLLAEGRGWVIYELPTRR